MNQRSHRPAIVFNGGSSAPAFSNCPAFSHHNVAKAGTNATFESQHFRTRHRGSYIVIAGAACFVIFPAPGCVKSLPHSSQNETALRCSTAQIWLNRRLAIEQIRSFVCILFRF